MKRKSSGLTRLKRSVPVKPRKNAANQKFTVVLPVGGVDELRARIGNPFEPMDFRQLLEQARQENSTNLDQQFVRIVREITTKQLNELLSAMHIKRTDSRRFQKAFVTIATALHGVGQVVWRPSPPRQRHWTLDNYATLYSLVQILKKWQGLSERNAIKKIAGDEQVNWSLPYRAHRQTQTSARSGQIDALWQAWMRTKSRKGEILSLLRSKKPLENVFGRTTLGRWEAKLVELDWEHLAPTIGKKRFR